MGTRNLTIVCLDNSVKVAQYCQWDGCPSSKGVDICLFLKHIDKEKFKKSIRECEFVDESYINNQWKILRESSNEHCKLDDFYLKYPQFDRDTGAKILDLIVNDNVRKLDNSYSFAADSLYCEWAYVIDLDNEVLEVYKGFNKTPLDKDERFYSLYDGSSEYYPVRKVASFNLYNISHEDMKKVG